MLLISKLLRERSCRYRYEMLCWCCSLTRGYWKSKFDEGSSISSVQRDVPSPNFLESKYNFFRIPTFFLIKVNIRWIYNKIFIDCRSYRSLFWFTNPRNWKVWHFYINCQILSYFFFYRMQKFGYHFKNHKLIYVRNTPEEFPMLLKFRALLSSNYSQ